jgi:hypothetical protein
VYSETGEIIMAIVEAGSGRAYSVIVLEKPAKVVEQTAFIRSCIRRSDATIVFLNLFDGLHAGITPDGQIVEVDEEFPNRRTFPIVASSLDEFFSRSFQSAAARAVWAYWLPE